MQRMLIVFVAALPVFGFAHAASAQTPQSKSAKPAAKAAPAKSDAKSSAKNAPAKPATPAGNACANVMG